MGIWKCGWSHINPTFKYKGPRIAWIGNPTSKTSWWRQVPGVCLQKFTPKKNHNRKKLDGVWWVMWFTISHRRVFRPPDFFFRWTFVSPLLLEKSDKATVSIAPLSTVLEVQLYSIKFSTRVQGRCVTLTGFCFSDPKQIKTITSTDFRSKFG
jgi:hypothetical protein